MSIKRESFVKQIKLKEFDNKDIIKSYLFNYDFVNIIKEYLNEYANQTNNGFIKSQCCKFNEVFTIVDKYFNDEPLPTFEGKTRVKDVIEEIESIKEYPNNDLLQTLLIAEDESSNSFVNENKPIQFNGSFYFYDEDMVKKGLLDCCEEPLQTEGTIGHVGKVYKIYKEDLLTI